MTPRPATTTTSITTTVGIDIGTESTKVVLGSRPPFCCEIVRSDAGMHTTPTAVSFVGKLRHVGETATLSSGRGGSNGIVYVNRLLSSRNQEPEQQRDFLEEFYPFTYAKADASPTSVTVDYNGEKRDFSAAAVLAMLLGSLKKSTQGTMERVTQGGDANSTATTSGTTADTSTKNLQYMLTVPPGLTESSREQLLDAAFAAGLDNTQLVELPVAYAMAYQRKFPHLCNSNTKATTTEEEKESKEGDGTVVMIVDMGHAQTLVTIIKFGGGDAAAAGTNNTISSDEAKESEDDATTKDSNNITTTTDDSPLGFTVLSCKYHDNLGAARVESRLWHHFQSTLPSLQQNVTATQSRAGQRLLQGTHKLKHLLSQLPEGQVTVENVGQNDTDATLFATRQMVADLCRPDAAALTELLESALDDCGSGRRIDAVEILGGGCRIPWVQSAIQQVVSSHHQQGGDDDNSSGGVTLSRSLDDTSAALGAALVGETGNESLIVATMIPPSSPSEDEDDTLQQRRRKLRQDEEIMASLDLEEHQKSDRKNQIEAIVLQLRSAKHGTHGALLASSSNATTNGDNTSTLDKYLDEIDDWLFSEQADMATLADLDTKLQTVVTTTHEMCADYYNAIQQEQAAKEKEMEEAAKQAQLEEQANGSNGGEEKNDDDHDNRRLPKKRRMEIVMKNKEEANELFKDGNWRFAAARYTKALTHCAKFVDLSPDDVKEVTDLKVTLNLNLALAYMKLTNVDQALRVCNEALALDDASVKAYYRRASVWYEKKRWDDAKKDITKAKKLSTGDDKSLQKLEERIDLQLKKQKQKEKKMASKMFG